MFPKQIFKYKCSSDHAIGFWAEFEKWIFCWNFLLIFVRDISSWIGFMLFVCGLHCISYFLAATNPHNNLIGQQWFRTECRVGSALPAVDAAVFQSYDPPPLARLALNFQPGVMGPIPPGKGLSILSWLSSFPRQPGLIRSVFWVFFLLWTFHNLTIFIKETHPPSKYSASYPKYLFGQNWRIRRPSSRFISLFTLKWHSSIIWNRPCQNCTMVLFTAMREKCEVPP